MGRHSDKIICLETGAIFSSTKQVANLLGCTETTARNFVLRKISAQDNRTYIKLKDIEFIDKDAYMYEAHRAKFRLQHTRTWYTCDQTGRVYTSLSAICKHHGWSPAEKSSVICNGIELDGLTFTPVKDKTAIQDYTSVLV